MSDEHKPDDRPRTVLVFEYEAEIEGEPVGPAVVSFDIHADPAQVKVETVPFVPSCVCEVRRGSPGDRCDTCGGEIGEPWVTLTEARARARELGLDLVKM